MPSAGAFRVTHPWGPQLPAWGHYPEREGAVGTWVGRTGLWEGSALAGLSQLQLLSSQRMATSQPGHRQSRDLDRKSHQDGTVQSWAYPCL